MHHFSFSYHFSRKTNELTHPLLAQAKTVDVTRGLRFTQSKISASSQPKITIIVAILKSRAFRLNQSVTYG